MESESRRDGREWPRVSGANLGSADTMMYSPGGAAETFMLYFVPFVTVPPAPSERQVHHQRKPRTFILLLCAITLCVPIFAEAPILGGALPKPWPLFPADNWWNLDISTAPVDPKSAAFIAFINSTGTKRLHPDFGGDASPGGVEIYGFPYITVDSSQPKTTVMFAYADESDGVDHNTGQSFPFYPIPDEAITQPHWIESGPPGNIDLRNQADRHMLIVDRDNNLLYELYNLFYDGKIWHAGSGAFFDMKTNQRRPEGWTSSDAAGLAILPGLVRYEEVYGSDEIRHAFRATVRATNGYVYPASHRAGSNLQALPLGARLRLKAGRDISTFPPEMQKVFRAMKKYGLIIADNGSDIYVSGTYDTRWNNDVLNPAFHSLNAGDFEVVQLGYDPGQITYFPHAAAGGGFATRFLIQNTGSFASSGTLSLVAQDGSPWVTNLSVAGSSPAPTAGSSVSITIPSGASRIITISSLDSAAGPQSGWARLESSGGTLSGVATFQLSDVEGLKTIAGVLAAQPVESATIPVDNDDTQSRFTGFAIANPNAEDISVKLVAIDENGAVRETISPEELNPLRPGRQIARFLHQEGYFPSRLNFRGSVAMVAPGGKQFIVVALLQNRGLYTAIPVTPTKAANVPN